MYPLTGRIRQPDRTSAGATVVAMHRPRRHRRYAQSHHRPHRLCVRPGDL